MVEPDARDLVSMLPEGLTKVRLLGPLVGAFLLPAVDGGAPSDTVFLAAAPTSALEQAVEQRLELSLMKLGGGGRMASGTWSTKAPSLIKEGSGFALTTERSPSRAKEHPDSA